MNVILSFSIILLIGLLTQRLLQKVRFPAVTSYLLLGILIGPTIFNLVSPQILQASGTISNIVLGIVAFSIGQNFSKKNLSKIGKSVIYISILEATGAFLCVTFALFFLLRQPLYISLIFGGISSATAPMATVMIIREYRAKGVLTNTLLGVVAIDDAWCLIIFCISLAVAKGLVKPGIRGISLVNPIFHSILEIGGAFALGLAVALIFSYFSRYIKRREEILIYVLGFILLNAGVSTYFHFSVLLTNMFFGAVLVNINKDSSKFFDALKTVDFLFYLFFFVLAGANLEIPLLGKLGLVGIIYFLFRIIGKSSGAFLGGYLSRAPASVRKYLGLGLIPQAGVALGVALIAKIDFPEVGGIIFATIIATTIVYEIIGPFCTKFALIKAKEI